MPADAAAAAAADYAAAGFGGRLGIGKRPALILIDFAMAYFVPESPLYAGVEAVAAAAVPVLAAARTAGLPVIHTRVEYRTPLEGGLFRRKITALACFETGNPLADFHPDLAPLAHETVITKQFPSAFFGTPLAGLLTASGIDTLLITGLTTSGCVRATAVDALCHGFAPVVLSDCVGDRLPAAHDANLFDLGAKTADVMTGAEAMAALR